MKSRAQNSADTYLHIAFSTSRDKFRFRLDHEACLTRLVEVNFPVTIQMDNTAHVRQWTGETRPRTDRQDKFAHQRRLMDALSQTASDNLLDLS